MADENECRDCVTNGICSLHEIEVERRQPLKYIPELLTSMNMMKGYSILATIFILGSFYYTQETKAELKDQDRHLEEKIDILTDNVSKLAVAIARSENKKDNLIIQLEKLNISMGEMVKKKGEENEICENRISVPGF